jgi:hypothetical protein
MSLNSLLAAVPAEAEHIELIAPAWVFPLIAAAIFFIVAIISWSFRDVYHRHADSTDGAASSHQDAHH